jgi:hypothetical protein
MGRPHAWQQRVDNHPQDTVDRFADLTGDHQWIHVDGERAKASPLGGTIVHGYLTLGVVPHLSAGIYWVQVRPELRRQQGPLPGPASGRQPDQAAHPAGGHNRRSQ